MDSRISFLYSRRKEIEEASFKNNVSPELLKRFWNLGSKWDGEKQHE
ncbi:hypothetical protein [Neobacillus drentensis]